MHCQYCGSINGEDDHRCLRCGRRITGIAIAAPTSYIGATALAVSAETRPETEFAPATAASPQQTPLFQPIPQPPAPSRLPAQKVIPFEQIQRQAATRFGPGDFLTAPAATPAVPPAAPPSDRPATQARTPAKKQTPAANQGNLDFRPGSSHGERILPTGITAQVSGEGRVAPPMRRVTAGAMDAAMVVLGFGLFAISAHFAGPLLGAGSSAAFGSGKSLFITLAAAMIFISLFYGLLWTLARRETAGMRWTQLRLVTFDGSALDGRDRAVRFVASWLSYCSGGLGLLWALADEESLAFHDHISKTYPTELRTTPRAPRRR